MAMDHFNARNSSIIPALAQFADCPVQFDVDRSLIFDSGTYGHLAVTSLWNQSETPCVVVGPFHDVPTLELSTMAVAADFPVVAHRAFNLRVTEEYSAPYTTSMFPDLRDSSKQLVSALKILNRTNYVAVLYASSDTGLQRRETMQWALETANITVCSFAYATDYAPVRGTQNTVSGSIRDAIRAVNQSGYRTIVVATENTAVELYEIADAAAEHGLTNGGYVWTWFGDITPQFGALDGNSNLTKLLAGSAWMTPLDIFSFTSKAAGAKAVVAPLVDAWFAQGTGEVERLKQMIPMRPGAVGYRNLTEDYFSQPPDLFSGFMYDAVMSAGMGACIAREQSSNGKVTTRSHVSGIRNVSVQGLATGVVSFGGGNSASGARSYYSTIWAVANLHPPGSSERATIPYIAAGEYFVPTDGFLGNGTMPFVFADGSHISPTLLRDPPDQNYLSGSVRFFGLILMGLVVVAAVVFFLWTYIHRKHRLVLASQPIFLCFLCLGAIVFVSSIATISVDESHGLTQTSLDRACRGTPWLVSFGHTIINGAIFSKLSRVHQVLQFARRKVTARTAAFPAALIMGLTLLLMSLWSSFDPLTWTRRETNERTGESIGRCECHNMSAWIFVLALLMITPSWLVAYFSWHTRDVDGAYSESYWIFIMMIVQIEVVLFAVPMILLLRDVSVDGRYLGMVSLLFAIPFSALVLIFLPKIVEYRRLPSIGDDPRALATRRRGAHGSVVVSGLARADSSNLRLDKTDSSAFQSKQFGSGLNDISNTIAEQPQLSAPSPQTTSRNSGSRDDDSDGYNDEPSHSGNRW
jgi:7 transmembrane sweet-taste receptor of 3 GCPR/Receptor family ligand binding region